MNDRLEEQLRSSLNRTADARPASTPDLGDVFGRARTIRRRRTAVVAGVAAAAVLAVVVPTGVILSDGGDTERGLPPATSSPDPTASSTPTSEPSASVATDAPAGLGIGGLSIGEHTQWSYLDPQQNLHAEGARIPKPLLKHGGGAPLIGFTPYHGGWILTYDDNAISQVDGSGNVIRDGRGNSSASTSDGMRTAYQVGSDVYSGIASGMGEGEDHWTLHQDEGLIGYLDEGPVVTDGKHGYVILTPGGGRRPVQSGIVPVIASSQAGLIGGVAGSPASGAYSGVVIDAASAQVLWHNKWRPMAFSPDGRYVAAVPVIDNGDPESYAILDAHTGAVVAQTPDSIADKVYLGWQVVWEGDDSILFQGFEADGEHRAALLRLTTGGLFNQASEPLAPVTTDQGQISFVLMSR